MIPDKNKDLLNQIAKLVNAFETLSAKNNRTVFEDAILERLEAGLVIFSETVGAFDEIWEVYESDSQGVEETLRQPSKESHKSEKQMEDSLGLGVGMAIGGIFDYLRSPKNVEQHNKGAEDIEILTDEELSSLEDDLLAEEEFSFQKEHSLDLQRELEIEIPTDGDPERQELEQYLEQQDITNNGEEFVNFMEDNLDIELF